MKKFLTILCLVLLSSYSYSQEVVPEVETVTREGLVSHQLSAEPFTGTVENFYRSGQLEERGNYKNGKMDGFREYFDKDGNLTGTEEYKDGELTEKEGELIMKELVTKYFEHFSNKDLENLSEMFSPEVKLQDWDILAEGKNNVLEANRKIFDSVETISVHLNELYIDNNVATCLIEIVINNTDTLKVIDIIKLDSDGKIKEISAYKQ